MVYVQKFNKRSKSWVKYKKMPNGLLKIVNVKTTKPNVPFKGVPKK